MNSKETFGVFIVEDHASFRQSLAMLLDYEEDFEVVGQAGSLEEARNFLKSLGKDDAAPSVGLLDLNLPDGEGTEIIGDFQRANPEFSALILTASIEDIEHARAIEAGASGVLNKASDVDEILEALRTLARGESLMKQAQIVKMIQMAARVRQERLKAEESVARLTKREMQVLTALSTGKSNKEIARDLRISVDTERTHMVNILSKLGAHSRLQALVIGVQVGLVHIDRAPDRMHNPPAAI